MFSFQLDDELRALQDTARRFAEAELRPAARDCEKARAVPEALLKKYHELGMSMLDLPEEAGGMACPVAWNVIMQEELAWGDPGIAAGMCGPGHAGAALMAFGSKEQQVKFLSPFAGPEAHMKKGALAFLEEDRGQEYRDMSVTAVKKGDKWELNGKKSYVLNGPDADLVVALAKTGEGKGWNSIKAFAVEGSADGMTRGKPMRLMGLNAVKVSDVTFDECAVDESCLLSGQPDTAAGLKTLADRMRPVDAARLVGTARAAYEYAVVYAQDRIAFGKPIAHFQAIAFLLSDMAIEVDAARWMVWRAGWAADKGHPQGRSSVAKAVAQANQSSLFITNNAVHILGGHGYIQDHPVEKWMRDARAHSILCGQTHLQNMVIADEALGKKADSGSEGRQ